MTLPLLLEARNVTKRFGGFTALNGVNLAIRPGERVGLIGPNGSGKSTLTNCLCGALRADSGVVLFSGERVDKLPAHVRARRGISRSFQLPRPFHSLSLLENLRVPLEYAVNSRRDMALSNAEMNSRASELLTQFGLGGKLNRRPRDLTQVEMRKLELARAMASNPSLLVADEAMAGLSASEVDEILALLMRLNEQGVAIIFIEHIMRAVMLFSERLIVLVAGKKIADGVPEKVISDEQVVGAYLGQ
jgi:branched-chain amino acid transport system ATP-binding protein